MLARSVSAGFPKCSIDGASISVHLGYQQGGLQAFISTDIMVLFFYSISLLYPAWAEFRYDSNLQKLRKPSVVIIP